MQILEKVHDRAVLPLNEAFAKLTARELGQDLLERSDDLVHAGTLGWVVLHHTCDQRLEKRKVGIDLARSCGGQLQMTRNPMRQLTLRKSCRTRLPI